MKTLIELYDERAVENVLAPEVLKPEQVIYLAPQEIAEDRSKLASLRAFYRKRGLKLRVYMEPCSVYRADEIRAQLLRLIRDNPECAVDITGGTDAALFAAGLCCAETGIPAFTYSRKSGRFYNISNAPFVDDVPCDIVYRV